MVSDGHDLRKLGLNMANLSRLLTRPVGMFLPDFEQGETYSRMRA